MPKEKMQLFYTVERKTKKFDVLLSIIKLNNNIVPSNADKIIVSISQINSGTRLEEVLSWLMIINNGLLLRQICWCKVDKGFSENVVFKWGLLFNSNGDIDTHYKGNVFKVKYIVSLNGVRAL